MSDRPKPLAEVGGRPFIEYLLEQVRRCGIRDVVLCTGHRAELVEAAFGDGTRLGMSITYSVEPEPLGTAGALKRLEPLAGGSPLLVMNGDSYFDLPIDELFAFHESHAGLASIALRHVAATDRFGRVDLDADGRVTEFREKGDAGGPGLINGGVYVFGPDVLPLIPNRTPLSLEREVFPRMIAEGIFGQPFEGFFVDIGLPSDYESLRARPEQLIAARS